jgi:2-iminobutanoate/2-iminopropanoate deaminase
MRRVYDSVEGAPAAVGPYSTAVSVGNILYTSGQLPIDPHTGDIIGDTVAQQAKQSLENLKTIIEKLGSDMKSLIKVTIFLTDMNCFSEFNHVYAEFFKDSYPARSCVEVSNLPKGAQIEIEASALIL